MLDYNLHVQSNYMLAETLIGSSGFVLGTPSRDEILERMIYGRSGRGKDFSNKRCILNNVRCYEDNDEYHLTDEEAWLCPARARGFSLTSKRFAFFLVEKIEPVRFKENAFSLLEMESLTKKTILALVEMHNSPLSQFDDFVAGKGKGVIMSLEGPPGSGKTLTAGTSLFSTLSLTLPTSRHGAWTKLT